MTSLAPSTIQSPEIIAPATENMRSLHNQVVQAVNDTRTATMRVAYFGWRLREAIGGNWKALGFENEEAYRESLGISKTTWFRALSIGQALSQLALEDLQCIPVTSAEALIQVDPNLWADYPWVSEAMQLPPNEFAERVDQRNRKLGNDREVMTYYRAKVSLTAKKFLEETVDKFRLEHGLATAGEALELLVSDSLDKRMRRLRGNANRGRNAENEKEVLSSEGPEPGEDFSEWSDTVHTQPGGVDGSPSTGGEDLGHAGVDLRAVQPDDEFDADDDDF